MQVFNFKAQSRLEMGKKVKALRAASMCPAVIYGPEIKENLYIKMREADARKLYEEAGESSIINLTIDEGKEPFEVLIKDVEYDPMTELISHIDFYKIKQGQKIEASVDIKFVGEAPAVKVLGGILLESRDQVTIKCLPKDLMAEIVVDLSGLKTFDDVIYVKNLAVPEGVEIMDEPEDVVVKVSEIKEEVIEEKAPETVMPEAEAKAEGEAGAAEGAKSAEEPKKEEKK